MLNAGRLQIDIQIESCACRLSRVGSDCLMPSFSQLLPQPGIDGLARDVSG